MEEVVKRPRALRVWQPAGLFLPAVICLLLILCHSSAIADPLRRFEYSQVAMGVRARIVIYAQDEAAASRAAARAFERIAQLEDIMSDYRPSSELMRLCAAQVGDAIRVSPELMFVLCRSKELARRSHGAFDITVGPLVGLWRTARRTGKLPESRELQESRRRVGWRDVVLDTVGRRVTLLRSGMRLDLGGIAKGYACDEALREIRGLGVTSALVEMGGDIALGDAPPGKFGWSVQLPRSNTLPARVALMANCAVSSSGDTEQFIEIAGARYSHVVDPRTGLGLTSRVAVTVIAPNAMLSDGLATALTVIGPREGPRLLNGFPRTTAQFAIADQ